MTFRAIILPVAAAVMLLAGCASPQAPAAPSADWSELAPLVDVTAAATLASFDETWTATDPGSATECWYQTDGDDEWFREDDLLVTVFEATSGYAEASLGKPSEVPVPTPATFVEMWADVPGLDARTDLPVFGGREGATATLLDSADVAISGGFDGDGWRVTITAACTTPGFAETPPA